MLAVCWTQLTIVFDDVFEDNITSTYEFQWEELIILLICLSMNIGTDREKSKNNNIITDKITFYRPKTKNIKNVSSNKNLVIILQYNHIQYNIAIIARLYLVIQFLLAFSYYMCLFFLFAQNKCFSISLLALGRLSSIQYFLIIGVNFFK